MRAGQIVFILVSISLFAYGVRHYQSDHVMTREEELQSYGPGTRLDVPFVHPNVKIDYIQTSGCLPPQVCTGMFELVRVIAPGHVFRLISPNQLQGYVTIANRADALSFVRLPYDSDQFEVTRRKDPNAFSAGVSPDSGDVSGFDGCLSAEDYRADGFSPTAVLGDAPPFHVRRWVWENPSDEVQLWDEAVGADGAYTRTVLSRKSVPIRNGEHWYRDMWVDGPVPRGPQRP